MPDQNAFENFSCAMPAPHRDRIILGHGSGGVLTSDLIHRVFNKYFHSDGLMQKNDAANLSIPLNSKRIAITTDSHIVSPLFFPGGDIGKLAVCGTVNDILTSGAVPRWLSAAFILEEGFPIDTLEKILESMQKSAEEAGVEIITGDTKVVERGKGDGIFINTTGIGFIQDDFQPGGEKARPGDAVMLTGTIGDHGMAVLCARGELGIHAEIASDTAPLTEIVEALRKSAPHTHVLRDPTRGGLSTTLNEIASQSNVGIELDEEMIPVSTEVASVCEMLGFDPFYVANEGKMILVVPDDEKEAALRAVRCAKYGEKAAIIGRVFEHSDPVVYLRTSLGTRRILDSLPGEMLPRIC
ncbi:MAG: hydrogenase expression/formation protein HypE [Flexilinea sp.]